MYLAPIHEDSWPPEEPQGCPRDAGWQHHDHSKGMPDGALWMSVHIAEWPFAQPNYRSSLSTLLSACFMHSFIFRMRLSMHPFTSSGR